MKNSPLQTTSVAEGASESVWSQHCQVVEEAAGPCQSSKNRRRNPGVLVSRARWWVSSATLTTISPLSGESCTVGRMSWLKPSQSAQSICIFAQSTVSRGILPVLRTTTFCTRWWCAETWRGGARNNAYGARLSLVELTRNGLTRGAESLVWNGRTVVRAWRAGKTHGQWAGMRLHRTNAKGKLEKEHVSLRVADFVWARVLVMDFCSSERPQCKFQAVWRRLAPISAVRPRTSHVTPRLGISV